MSLIVYHGYRWKGKIKTLSALRLSEISDSFRARAKPLIRTVANRQFADDIASYIDEWLRRKVYGPNDTSDPTRSAASQAYEKWRVAQKSTSREPFRDFSLEWAFTVHEKGLFVRFFGENHVTRLLRKITGSQWREYGFDSRSGFSGAEGREWEKRGNLWEEVLPLANEFALGSKAFATYGDEPFTRELGIVLRFQPSWKTRVKEQVDAILLNEAGVAFEALKDGMRIYQAACEELRQNPAKWQPRRDHLTTELSALLPKRITIALAKKPLRDL